MSVMKNFSTLFKRGVDGRVLPEINPDHQWVLGTDNGLMTIKLDGACLKVEWNSIPPSGWKIYLKMSNDNWVLTDPDNPLDKPFWTAWKNLTIKQDGIYEAYGEGINGNPHNIAGTYMIRIVPVDYSLIVARGHSKIERGIRQTEQQLYDQILAEFKESPEIEGLVFHLEGSGMALQKAATITKKDFGLVWPEPREIILLPGSDINNIPAV